MHVATVLSSHLFVSVKGLNGAVMGNLVGFVVSMDEILQIQKKGCSCHFITWNHPEANPTLASSCFLFLLCS